MAELTHIVLALSAFTAGAVLARVLWPGAFRDPRAARVVACMGVGVTLASAL
ncbi:MAG: hypothetical protein LC624_09325 [Halobacteriales archaeon]|nr:hypothetical protein [Halobacteriales archaeon]